MNREKKTHRSVSAVIGTVLCVISVPVIIINLILIIGSYLKPDELPGVFGVKPAVVLSGSMEPSIETADMILIHKTDPEKLKEGDVICYLLSGKAITHRIKSVTDGADGQVRYITQGDANNSEDRLAVSPDQVQGIWRGTRIGSLGRIIMAMQTPAGMLITVLCPLLLFIFGDIWIRRKADRLEMEQNAREKAELEAELAAMKRKLDIGSTSGGKDGSI